MSVRKVDFRCGSPPVFSLFRLTRDIGSQGGASAQLWRCSAVHRRSYDTLRCNGELDGHPRLLNFRALPQSLQPTPGRETSASSSNTVSKETSKPAACCCNPLILELSAPPCCWLSSLSGLPSQALTLTAPIALTQNSGVGLQVSVSRTRSDHAAQTCGSHVQKDGLDAGARSASCALPPTCSCSSTSTWPSRSSTAPARRVTSVRRRPSALRFRLPRASPLRLPLRLPQSRRRQVRFPTRHPARRRRSTTSTRRFASMSPR